MRNNEFINASKTYLEDHSDAKRAESEKAYLYSDLYHYGASSQDRIEWIKENKEFIKELDKSQMIELVELLWSEPSFEEKSLSLSVLNMHLDMLDFNDMPLIDRMMRESRGWALLDGLVIPVMPTIIDKDKRTYSIIKEWILDDDYWVRRSALLSQLLFFRYDNGGDRELFFKMSISQFDESWINEIYLDTQTRQRARFFIRKAIGWSLREMSVKQPEVVFTFLKDNMNEMSGLSFREGSRKLSEGVREELASYR